jgi:hypothetical protein
MLLRQFSELLIRSKGGNARGRQLTFPLARYPPPSVFHIGTEESLASFQGLQTSDHALTAVSHHPKDTAPVRFWEYPDALQGAARRSIVEILRKNQYYC